MGKSDCFGCNAQELVNESFWAQNQDRRNLLISLGLFKSY